MAREQHWFERREDGTYSIELPQAARDLLRGLIPELRELVASGDPLGQRLFPPAYAFDEEKEAGYRALAGEELIEKRLATIEAVESALDSTKASEETVMGLLRTVNDLRLVIGTRLGIETDEDHHREVDPDDPEARLWIFLDLLDLLLGELVRGLQASL